VTRAFDVTRHRHAEPPFAIDLPADVEVADGLPGVLLAARDPGAGAAFRANLTVSGPVSEGTSDLSAYVSAALEQARETFAGWWLIDRTQERIGDRAAERTLGTYLLAPADEPIPVALEQWWLLAEGRAWIVSGSCETADFPRGHEAWRRSAESLRIGREE
jgi:hypothetical protein